MKKFCFWLILAAVLCSACSPSRWFLVDSSGIMTYDRLTGKWEIMWEYKTSRPVSNTDSVCVNDSLFADSVK